MKQYVLFGSLALLIVCLFFPSIKLRKTADRAYSDYQISPQLKKRIAKETSELPHDYSVIDYCLSLTAELLDFSEKNNIKQGKANCVGYTKLFTGICNYALKVNHCDGRAMPVVGYIQWCGINLCDAALVVAPEEYKSFVKDHDFVELEYDQKHVYIDPTIYDATGDECTTTISK